MKSSAFVAVAALGLVLTGVAAKSTYSAPARVTGWLSWRGPSQDGVSAETGLPDKWQPGGVNDLWSYPISGGGTPVIANDHVYVFGYSGEGPDLQEALLCFNANTGKKLWEKRFNDYLSDIVYNRYAIGSPAVDPETGNVYLLTSMGDTACYTPDGKEVWRHSMMEEYGRLTFPNNRTGAPLVLGDMVIIRGITSNWGGEGAPADRMYAFDKRTGGLIWSSTPGVRPKDNSFGLPVVAMRKGKQVLYAGTGDGNIVCVNARTGEGIWRYPVSAGGMNSSVILYKGKIIAIHADENLDSSEKGREVAVNVDAEPGPPNEDSPTPIMPRSAEAWRNTLESISSSPVVVGSKIYQVNSTGNLCCVNADTGAVLWRYKLGPDELHASPLYADGKLYVPLHNGMFFILKPTETGCEELTKVQLDGTCIGAPSVWNGKIYVLSTGKLYCFGKKSGGNPPAAPAEPKLTAGKTVALQIIPAEVLLKPGQKVGFKIRGIDANGFPTENFDPAKAKWAKFIPPTAKVRAEMNGEFNSAGELVAASAPEPSAGAWEATIGEFKGHIRGRVLPAPPVKEDFEHYDLSVPHATEAGVKFAYPPLPWIGARFKFEVRDKDGNKCLTKTLDNVALQRATVFLGEPETKNYTLEADLMSDGSRRLMSNVGLVNQRYLVTLLGNAQILEVSSNQERVKANVPFKWDRGVWYHMKTRVDLAADGSGVVRVKCFKKGEPEPAAWTIEVPHKHAHQNGSPGLFGFSPSSMYRVYIDNVAITPN